MFPEQNILRRPRRVVIESGWGKPVYQDMDTGEVSIGDDGQQTPNSADQALQAFRRTREAQGTPAASDSMFTANNAGAATRPRIVGTPPTQPQPTNLPTDPSLAATGYDPNNTDTRPWKVGGSLERDPLKREQARIQAMIDNPTASVSPTGAVAPPHPFSRKKAALLGALYGAGMAGQSGNLAAMLGGAATGAGIGVANPRSIQEWRRRMEVEDAQKQLGIQQKLTLGGQQIESERAETRQRELAPEIAMANVEERAAYNRERIRVQREVAEGRMTVDEANRQLREKEYQLHVSQAGETKRHNLETESNARLGKTGKDKTAENAAKRAAKLKEAEDTKANAEIYEGNADTNEQLANAEPKEVDPLTGEEKESKRATELRQQAQEQRRTARELRAKIPGIQADANAIPETATATGKYAGQRIAASRLPEAAKRLGMTPERARQYLTDEGAVIY